MIHFAYHPLVDDLDTVLDGTTFERALVIDEEVSSLYDLVSEVRTLDTDEIGLPSGLYTFQGIQSSLLPVIAVSLE